MVKNSTSLAPFEWNFQSNYVKMLKKELCFPSLSVAKKPIVRPSKYHTQLVSLICHVNQGENGGTLKKENSANYTCYLNRYSKGVNFSIKKVKPKTCIQK